MDIDEDLFVSAQRTLSHIAMFFFGFCVCSSPSCTPTSAASGSHVADAVCVESAGARGICVWLRPWATAVVSPSCFQSVCMQVFNNAVLTEVSVKDR